MNRFAYGITVWDDLILMAESEESLHEKIVMKVKNNGNQDWKPKV